MTSRPPFPNGPAQRTSDASGAMGPFIGIGLPQALAADLAGGRRVLSLAPEDIAAADLHRIPDVVVACLLLGSAMDALDVIAVLSATGYSGALTVVAPPLPNPRMVERELARAAKPMDVTLVIR